MGKKPSEDSQYIDAIKKLLKITKVNDPLENMHERLLQKSWSLLAGAVASNKISPERGKELLTIVEKHLDETRDEPINSAIQILTKHISKEHALNIVKFLTSPSGVVFLSYEEVLNAISEMRDEYITTVFNLLKEAHSTDEAKPNLKELLVKILSGEVEVITAGKEPVQVEQDKEDENKKLD